MFNAAQKCPVFCPLILCRNVLGKSSFGLSCELIYRFDVSFFVHMRRNGFCVLRVRLNVPRACYRSPLMLASLHETVIGELLG